MNPQHQFATEEKVAQLLSEAVAAAKAKGRHSDEPSMDENIAYVERKAPKWYASHYALPTLFSLVPLFGVARSDKADSESGSRNLDVTFPETCHGGLHYEGPVITQYHKRVLGELVSYINNRPVDGVISFNPYKLIEAMGYGAYPRNRELLRDAINLLMKPLITVWRKGGNRRQGLKFRLVAQFDGEDNECWFVQLSSAATVMLQDMQLTYLSRSERSKLRDGLQTFLYDYYRAKPQAHEATYEDLHAASGSRATDMKEFAREVREAAATIKAKCKWGMETPRGSLKMHKTTLAKAAA